MKITLNKAKNWITTLFVTKDLNKLVIMEATNLKKYVKFGEIDQLDFESLDPESKSRCIYGQMTGNCNSVRAYELIKKCASRVYTSPKNAVSDCIERSKLNGQPYELEDAWSRIWYYFSPIEKFIAQKLPNQAENNRILIEFLKGERDKLEFVK